MVGLVTPEIMLTRVDFPAPFGPMTASSSPFADLQGDVGQDHRAADRPAEIMDLDGRHGVGNERAAGRRAGGGTVAGAHPAAHLNGVAGGAVSCGSSALTSSGVSVPLVVDQLGLEHRLQQGVILGADLHGALRAVERPALQGGDHAVDVVG